MALRFSKAFRNFINEGGSLKHALAGGKLLIYTGSQPTTADDAVAGSLLVTLTLGGAAHTNEVQSQGKVALTGGGSGSVNTLTVNGIEIMGSATSFDTSLTVTAAAIADKINNNPKNYLFKAVASGADITITAKSGMGTLPNGWVVASTTTTITKTDTNMGTTTAGVNSANGLTFGDSAAGVIVKNPTETWSGTASGTGTAGWFRFVGPQVDAGAADASEVFHRVDGNIATSGANLNMSNTAIVTSAVQTLNTFSLTYPASA
jgi:hypothetical protein